MSRECSPRSAVHTFLKFVSLQHAHLHRGFASFNVRKALVCKWFRSLLVEGRYFTRAPFSSSCPGLPVLNGTGCYVVGPVASDIFDPSDGGG